MKPTLKVLSLTILAALACDTALAQVKAPGRRTTGPTNMPESVQINGFGGNLEVNTCTGCNFDEISGGYYVWGPNNCETPGTTQWIGVPFISKRTGNARRISAGIEIDPACVSTGTRVTLGIYTDDCTTGVGPTVVGSLKAANVSAGPCVLAVANNVNAALTQGTRYWVGATTDASAQQMGLSAIWYGSNQSQIGGNVASGGWFFFSGFVPSFSVD